MANSLITFRSAFVQAQFNERMAKILTYEIVGTTFIGAALLAYWFGWQWLFWGIILVPLGVCIGLCIPIISDLILTFFGVMWMVPFLLVATILNVHAFYLAAIVAFFMSFWVHGKAFSWYTDVSREDG